MKINKKNFYDDAQKNLETMIDNLSKLKPVDFSDLSSEKTALFIVDMINGFAKEGTLYSENVRNLIPGVVELTEKFIKNDFPVYAFKDYHTKESVELVSYPAHAMEDTVECELVDELKAFEKIVKVNKNSTNGFLVMKPETLDKFDNFVVVGDCTDICIYQFAVTLKVYLNEKNENKRVIVPVDLVDTFDLEGHDSDLMNVVFLHSMIANGVEVVEKIK